MIRVPPQGTATWRVPLPGESFDGYLAYRAARALMPGPYQIAALGGASYAHYSQLAFGDASQQDGLQEVADELGIAVAELRMRAHPEVEPGRRRFHATTIDGKLIE